MHETENGSTAGGQPDAPRHAKVVRLETHQGPGRAAETTMPPIDGRLVSLLAPNSLEAEQYRTLRHVLEERRAEMRVIAVTSAVSGEGKTTTAINLAAALAQDAETRVLLVDADLRAPSVGRLLGLDSAAPGLVESARDGNGTPEDFVKRRPPSRLAILPAGRTPEHPYEALKSAGIGKVMQAARGLYDFIVVDTPPLLPVPDNRALAKWVDGFLLVVAAHRTPRHLLEEGLRVLEHARVAGIVFNGDDRPSSAYYGSYYGHGRDQGDWGAARRERPVWKKVGAPWR